MSKKLVAYFSASGVTAKVAETLAEAIGADIFEIEPKVPYTEADLNWMDKNARSTIEMNDPASRPEIAVKRDNMKDYDTICVAFPVPPPSGRVAAPVLAGGGLRAGAGVVPGPCLRTGGGCSAAVAGAEHPARFQQRCV